MTEAFLAPAVDPSAAGAVFDLTPPDGVAVDHTLLAEYRDQASRAGLTPDQARALFSWWNDRAAAVSAQGSVSDAARRAEAETLLRQEWGRAYEGNLDLARRAVRRFGGAELLAALERSRLGDDPAVIRAFAAIGKLIAEPALVGQGQAGFGMTPSQARGEIARLKTDQGFLTAYTDLRHPSHDEAVRRMVALQAAAG